MHAKISSHYKTNSENSTDTNLYSAGAEAVVDVAVAAAAEGVALVVAAPVDTAGVAVEKQQTTKSYKIMSSQTERRSRC